MINVLAKGSFFFFSFFFFFPPFVPVLHPPIPKSPHGAHVEGGGEWGGGQRTVREHYP